MTQAASAIQQCHGSASGFDLPTGMISPRLPIFVELPKSVREEPVNQVYMIMEDWLRISSNPIDYILVYLVRQTGYQAKDLFQEMLSCESFQFVLPILELRILQENQQKSGFMWLSNPLTGPR